MKIDRAAPSRPVASSHAPLARGRASPSRAFVDVLREGAPQPPSAGPPRPAAVPVGAAPTPAAPTATSPLVRQLGRALAGAAAGENKLDAILDAAARGKTFTPAELLSMQATVFRYSQTVEVVSRATDRLVGALKQTLGTQV